MTIQDTVEQVIARGRLPVQSWRLPVGVKRGEPADINTFCLHNHPAKGGRTQPNALSNMELYIQYLHILIKIHNLICIYLNMLVPGIHSDSKIKLQEEVCTRRNKRVWVTGERLASLFFQSVSSVWLNSAGFRRAAWAFSLALRRSSPTPLKHFVCLFVYWRRQRWTHKKKMR